MRILPGRYEKLFVNSAARNHKESFEQSLDAVVSHTIEVAQKAPVQDMRIVSFSGKSYIVDQLYCLASYYNNVGLPHEWLVVSDGTYTEKENALLHSIPNVRVRNWVEASDKIVNGRLMEFVEHSVFGKRLHAFINLEIDRTTILTDTDVLFYRGMNRLIPALQDERFNWFMLDHGPKYMPEEHYWKAVNEHRVNHLNAGFLVLNWRPDWDIALSYIIDRDPDDLGWGNFTDQCAIEEMFHNQLGSRLLNPKYFVFDNEDGFTVSHKYDYERIAVRHYAGAQARNKMWHVDWRKVIGMKTP